jgi:copper chaperone NosL
VRVIGALVLAFGLGLAGCGGGGDPLAPPEIVYGEDICDACGMIIMDPRFAAALVVEVGGRPEPRKFDDIGDLVAYQHDHPALPVLRAYVHDYDTEEWLVAEEASFVRTAELVTPMDHGLAAFGSGERAAAFASETAGSVLSYADLLESDAVHTGES